MMCINDKKRSVFEMGRNGSMVRKCVAVSFYALCLLTLGAQNVPHIDRCAIATVSHAVSYQEYEGAYVPAEVSTETQIRDIGRMIGTDILNLSKTGEASCKGNICYYADAPSGKYSARRCFSAKGGCDFFFINEQAKVDKIRNVERILSGYIQTAFCLGQSESDVISHEICLWNTEQYGASRFSKKYCKQAAGIEKMGLSANYKDWCGHTCIVIPHEHKTGAACKSALVPGWLICSLLLKWWFWVTVAGIVLAICFTVCFCNGIVSLRKKSLLKKAFKTIQDVSPDINSPGEETITKREKQNGAEITTKTTIKRNQYTDIMKAYLNAVSEL